jgi:hypothetical protein
VLNYHPAQLNIAKMKYGFEDPELADFIAALDSLRELGPTAKAFTFRKLFDPE